MRVAAVDCGTNTIRLLVLDDTGGEVRPVVRASRIVRLGEGVDATGRLAPAAVARTLTALDEYVGLMGQVDRVRVCATSAVRDATDGAEAFVAGVRPRLGTEPEVLSGDQEARLTFAGAVRGLRAPALDSLPDPVLVVDIGGGSTELVLGPRAAVRAVDPVGVSLDVGAVRLAERHLRSDPPTAAELASCAADVDAALDHGEGLLAEAGSVVGVAGTVLTLAAGLLGVPGTDDADQAVVDVDDVVALIARLAAMTTAERVATGWVDPGRADVLPAGGVVLERVLHRTGVRVLVASVGDVLDGIAWSLLP